MERLRLELDSRRRRIERRIRRAERKVEAAYYGSDTSESSGDEVDREKAAEDYARLALEKKRKLQGGWRGGVRRGGLRCCGCVCCAAMIVLAVLAHDCPMSFW